MKTINIINHNNKLQCQAFIHIAPAPAAPISESSLPIKVHIEEQMLSSAGGVLSMLEGTKSDPIKFDAEMIGFLRFKLNELPSTLVHLSHGMGVDDFRKQHISSGVTNDLAVYTYLKLK